MSRDLVLHQHDEAGDDVERRHQDDQRQDQEHHIALDFAAASNRLEFMSCQVMMRANGPAARAIGATAVD